MSWKCLNKNEMYRHCTSSQSFECQVQPSSSLIELLKPQHDVPNQELFSMKQLCLYLKEYIREKQLYDELDPRIVHCASDPLGNVFGVDKFSLFDVIDLLKKQVTHFESTDSGASINLGCLQPASKECSEKHPFHVEQVPFTVASSKRKHSDGDWLSAEDCDDVQIAKKRTPFEDENRNKLFNPSSDTEAENYVPKRQKKRDFRRKLEKKISSSSLDAGGSGGSARVRQSSLSIMYNDGQAGGCPLLFIEVESEGDSEVLSVQSKETAVVKDSSDDFWFLDSDDQISVHMGDGGFSVQFSTEGPELTGFSEEYEVLSEDSIQISDSDADFGGDSESPIEEIVVVCNAEDTEFWADSESSDTEQDSTDDDMKDDKWSCKECQTMNSPILRYCARCWKLRPGWLLEQSPRKRPPRRTKTQPLKPAEAVLPPMHGQQTNQALSLKHGKAMSVAEKVDLLLDRPDSLPCTDVDSSDEFSKKPSMLKRSDTVLLPESSSCASRTCTVTRQTVNSPSISIQDYLQESGKQKFDHSHGIPVEKPLLRKDDSGFGSFQDSSFSLTNSQNSYCIVQDNQLSSDILSDPPVSNTENKFTCLLPTPTSEYFEKTFHKDDQTAVSEVNVFAKSPMKTKIMGADLSDMCVVCLNKPKEASIIHGKTGHQVCCYVCAKQLRRRGKACPVCRRPIQKVIKNFIL